MKVINILLAGALFVCTTAYAQQVVVPMSATDNPNVVVGTITANDTKYGVMFTPNLTSLSNLAPGVHGFHVHVNPSCADGGMAAGGHLDPKNTKHHHGPYRDDGHLGDLPAVYVKSDHTISIPVVAPRLKVSDILGHSLMIHNGGDNYSDTPAPLGGGGPRMLCGVIPKIATN